MKKDDSDTEYPPEEAQQRLRAILKGAFSGSPTPLKAIPRQNGAVRAIARKVIAKKRRKAGQ